jgi:hypothetical protein
VKLPAGVNLFFRYLGYRRYDQVLESKSFCSPNDLGPLGVALNSLIMFLGVDLMKKSCQIYPRTKFLNQNFTLVFGLKDMDIAETETNKIIKLKTVFGTCVDFFTFHRGKIEINEKKCLLIFVF